MSSTSRTVQSPKPLSAASGRMSPTSDVGSRPQRSTTRPVTRPVTDLVTENIRWVVVGVRCPAYCSCTITPSFITSRPSP
jgi:hypothetical protein